MPLLEKKPHIEPISILKFKRLLVEDFFDHRSVWRKFFENEEILFIEVMADPNNFCTTGRELKRVILKVEYYETFNRIFFK